MKTIKTIIFDLGGVIFAQSFDKALAHFKAIGVTNADELLDPYAQAGFFGDLESGVITAEQFRQMLSEIADKELSVEDCVYAWTGYVDHLPQRNLDNLRRLRQAGYRLVLLSNTNPFMMQWAMSNEFDGSGNSLRSYFDACYLSYECKVMKPSPEIFKYLLAHEGITPDEAIFVDDSPRNAEAARKLGITTICPQNNSDWSKELFALLNL